ncbi:MAG: CPBP family intramembrane metalloprotease [Chloroflexi bacterium]|nr:CPBP family intramembrane metalloprotease [Chloroflexota bacterium]MCL5275457.1 CPBP family intramembrane metalloprotease [Chloroflexota bacterium]
MAVTEPVVSPTLRTPTWRFADVALVGALSLVILLAGVYGLKLLVPDTLALSLTATALEGIVLIGAVYFLGIRRRKLDWSAVGLRATTTRWIVAAIGAGLLALVLTGIIAVLVQMLLHENPQNPQLPFLAPQGFTWAAFIGMFVLAGMVVPFAEELFFRGMLYTWLRDRWGVWIGTFGSAILFGLAHGNIAIAAGVGFMGLLQAVVYERSRSLWTTFLIHAINNSIKVVLLYMLLAMGVKLQ